MWNDKLECGLIVPAILSWFQFDGTKGFSKDQLKGKHLLLVF